METGFVSVGGAELFTRASGEGPVLLVLHGGPEFDHTYLVPDIDLLAGSNRVITYDQRGRGKSTGEAEDVTLASDVDDIDAVRRHFGSDRMALMGHSWGCISAAEYALRYPERLSRLVMLSSAPVSTKLMKETRRVRSALLEPLQDQLKPIAESDEFRKGDPEVVGRYWQLVFRTGTKDPADSERLNFSLRNFTKEGILRARRIMERLYVDTFDREDFDMAPRLKDIRPPTLVMHGTHDFIPLANAEIIAAAIPGARFEVLQDCGHFPLTEVPEVAVGLIEEFLRC